MRYSLTRLLHWSGGSCTSSSAFLLTPWCGLGSRGPSRLCQSTDLDARCPRSGAYAGGRPLAGGGYVNLYAIEDVYSRYVVGWMVAPSESATLASQLVETSAQRQQLRPGHLTLHADRGSVMTSELLTQLLRRLGITQTHSRLRISDDNPFSESLFKTLKYHPGYPARFDDCAAAQAYFAAFFAWYNAHHKHSGLTYLSPAQVHLGQAAQHRAARNTMLAAAFDRHPERLVHGLPTAPALPDAVWINPPSPEPQPLGQDPKEPLQ